MKRLMRFRIVDLRSRVQEQALSHAFDEVKSQLAKRAPTLRRGFSGLHGRDGNESSGSERTTRARAAVSLDALSPLAVLQRGYAIAQDASGKPVRDAASVAAGDEVSVRLAKGKLNTRVETVEELVSWAE